MKNILDVPFTVAKPTAAGKSLVLQLPGKDGNSIIASDLMKRPKI